MDHRQRLQACLSGAPVDRPPVALWRHFPVDDQNPVNLAASVLRFQELYDFDFIKITPASSYCVRDYGTVDEWRGNPEGTRDFVSYPIQKPDDWGTLPHLSANEGNLKMQQDCIRFVISDKSKDTPVIQTIFDPITQAKNLVGKENLLDHLREHPQELHAGLQRITENTLEFIKAIIPMGIEGIFFAVQYAQSNLLSKDELNTFVMAYDRELMESVKGLWLNVIHIHGKNIYFDNTINLPGSVVNWHDQETSPNLQEGKERFHGAVCGGLRQWDTLVYGTPDKVAEESRQAIKVTNGERFILGTGCVLPIIAPHSNIIAARRSVDFVS